MTPEENDLLCRVEGDAPMGQLMRRHWVPVCMAEEVAEPGGAPLRARLLGEDLVVFRDSEGRLGVLEEHCPHRGASLVYGRNEAGGLRCLYHGWKFDVEGRVLEMFSEPHADSFAEKLRHRAYPARESGGFVWVYMGPPAEMPAFQPPAWQPTPTAKVSIVKMHVAANWAQTLEGGIDSAHSSSLHSTEMPPAEQVERSSATDGVWLRPSADKAPRLQVQKGGYGFRYAAIRKPFKDPDTHDYVRITVFIAPFTALIPPNNVYNVAQMNVPIDDGNTWFYFLAWSDPAENRGPGITQDEWRRFNHAVTGIDLDADFRKVRNRDNHYQQDRAAMKQGDFTGIKGIPTQDMAMWESMGRIRPRTGDRLGASDVAIVQFRRQMVDAARAFQQSGAVLGIDEPRIPHACLKSFEGIIPKSTDWRSLGEDSLTPA
jgi:phthalate 4,5-dioxygenase oxygenase subunit